jgi:hypothetical protein
MSRDAWIDVHFVYDIIPSAMVATLIESGWNFNHFGNIMFLPVGDKDDFDWQYLSYSDEHIEEVLKVVRAKEAADELIGLVLMWQDSEVGTDLLLSQNRMQASCMVNRKILPPPLSRVTDVSWYLERVLGGFGKQAESATIEFRESN